MDDARLVKKPLLYNEEVFEIIGAAMDVHRELKSGFKEEVYQEALEIEMTDRGIPHEPHKLLRIRYKSRTLKKEYAPDLVCHGKIIVEIKALSRLSGTEESQVLNYLKVSGLRVGLLVNFGSIGRLEWKRYIN
ncbi:MAG: NADH:ubiquinone oxidoreductase [Candidatus Lindowbacteria bacterium RIFCSPLOWO2_12_FULL_62_27]|nr:MAG: NADH:ubiquinone oxidoreductase [Candidatus Lindowbacteria bacterium RIFCSPLOWO2_12_FULL_62_27]OGH63365.1 MAG: NADH:ubiquinone oxidoreductase [Candidatus Lindowbacteria bacterium RIFCSPLOWO2_02_FULL_62_12]